MTANSKNNLPFEINDVDSKVAEEVMKYFTGELSGYIRAGPKGYFLSRKYKREAANFYHMELRPSDIFVVTYPRSGTTWTQELVWLLANDMDFTKAKAVPLLERFPFLDVSILINPVMQEQIIDKNKDNADAIEKLNMMFTPVMKILAAAPSPRFVKSHLPLSLLPPSLLDTSKVVYVARDPRDVAVSFYHHNRLLNVEGFVGDFKTFWNLFIRDLVQYTPFFEMVKEAWNERHNSNMLFLFYEELSKDLPEVVQRVCKFLGKQYSDEQVLQLCEHLKIDNFKKNKSITMDDFMYEIGIAKRGEEPFIRKGKVGGWRDYFDVEMTQQAERWMADNLRDTDLRFPNTDS